MDWGLALLLGGLLGLLQPGCGEQGRGRGREEGVRRGLRRGEGVRRGGGSGEGRWRRTEEGTQDGGGGAGEGRGRRRGEGTQEGG